MRDRFVELVALGPELRKQAESKGKSVTEAHLLVHEVLAQAFADLHRIPNDSLRAHVTTALEFRLGNHPIPNRATCRRTGVLRARRIFERVPAVWRAFEDASEYPHPYAVAGNC
jgi:hypothetical protein